MKIIAATIFILFCGTSVLCQVSPNASFIDATFSFNRSDEKEEFAVNSGTPRDFTSSNLFSSLEYGFALSSSDFLLFGLSHDRNGFTYESTDFDGDPISFGETSNLYSVNAAFEKFFSIKSNLFIVPRISGSVGIGTKTYEDDGEEADNNLIGYSFAIVPRVQYFLNEKWAITGSFGNISFSKRIEKLDLETADEDPKNRDIRAGVFFGVNTFSLGIRYYLNNALN